jgi:acetyl-CoA carboxylase biotin carboxylase subunit
MIVKLIVWATKRSYAIERMRRVLYEFKIGGLPTNISYLRRIMNIPDFVNGFYDTSFLDKHKEYLQKALNKDDEEGEVVAMIAAYIDYIANLEENIDKNSDNNIVNRWRQFGLQKGVLRI